MDEINFEFYESLVMARNKKQILIKIFSIKGGEGFSVSQSFARAVIKKTGIGLEIIDDEKQKNLMKIYYGKIKDVQLMKASNTIITYIYDTLHIQVII